MQPRQLSPTYHVSPQIDPADAPAIKAAGIHTVICNRPDDENPAGLQIEAMQAAIEAEGLNFVALPFNQMTLTLEIVAAHRDAIAAADGPVLAYCASGNRCTIVWALGQAEAGAASVEDLLGAATRAGYDLSGLRGTLESLAAQAAARE